MFHPRHSQGRLEIKVNHIKKENLSPDGDRFSKMILFNKSTLPGNPDC